MATATSSTSTAPSAIIPIVLPATDGAGLWPLARDAHPLPLQPLLDGAAPLGVLVEALSTVGRPLVLCREAHRHLVTAQFGGLPVEPRTLMTAPDDVPALLAVVAAALMLEEENPDAALVLVPAEAAVADAALFAGGLRAAVAALEEDGHRPLGAGMVAVARPAEVLKAVTTHCPDVLSAARAALSEASAGAGTSLGAVALDGAVPAVADLFPGTPEPDGLPGVQVLDGWAALAGSMARDEAGNRIWGDVVQVDCKGTAMYGAQGLLAVVGMEDAVVATVGDAVLVASAKHAHRVPALVEDLKARGRPEVAQPRRTHRPWGWFQTIDAGPRFQVKEIMVKPGACLSLQMHYHRSEHWVVVEGMAEVTCGDNTFLVNENESAYIPVGSRHRLRNPGKMPVRLIEVQSGAYCGEDDIVRLEDIYGRVRPPLAAE